MKRTTRMLLAAVVAAGALGASNPAQAIVDGQTMSGPGANVAVNPGCSGTLLNRKWAIAAWHCFSGTTPAGMAVRWGNLNWQKGHYSSVIRVEHRYDIALVQLASAIPAGAAEYATLATADPPIGATVEFYGWGRTDYDKPAGATYLQQGKARVIKPWNNGFGDNAWGPSWTITNVGTGNPSYGDSGGGAWYGRKLVGVTSNADRSGANFASIASNLTWIRSVIG